MKIIKQGAEAIISLNNNIIVKERVKKNYRIDEIDRQIRKFRTKREVKLLNESNVVNVPMVFSFSDNEMKINMEFLDGKLLRDVLKFMDKKERLTICKEIGEDVAKLHNKGIIHGDLTTSNFIIKDNKVYFIDFGLGFFSDKVEDKAVDVFLLKQALNAKHFDYANECFSAFMAGYKSCNNYTEVINRLKKVEGRGRYKK